MHVVFLNLESSNKQEISDILPFFSYTLKMPIDLSG